MREKSIGKRTSEERTIEVFSTRQTIQVNYTESKMVRLSNCMEQTRAGVAKPLPKGKKVPTKTFSSAL